MKKILFAVLFVLGNLAVHAQDAEVKEIKWMTLDEALKLQKDKPKKSKPIFMDVYTDWCGPCKMLDKNTFHDPKFVDYITENYYPVKFNGEGNFEVTYKGKKYANPGYDPNRKGRNSVHEFTMFLQVQGYPSMYVFDKAGEVKNPIVGYLTADQVIEELKKIN
ncbi:thioredoxin family protein [Flavobacterium enshiense DK69]|uniref:Thioredoxin n=1 Tax=Flavobacterium enshiense DK69 TaxID=1107311 RepID=V6S9E8_9FLAO|nr:thioredoxin fold domain-containing protein [Flavobacterium enshiense]ESU21035.1 thioredoxin family protein [Flavobacterium enshiense DK69]KGO95294.1 thioredoxin [Flavobacterium enshiense DK69]